MNSEAMPATERNPEAVVQMSASASDSARLMIVLLIAPSPSLDDKQAMTPCPMVAETPTAQRVGPETGVGQGVLQIGQCRREYVARWPC